MNSVTMEKLVSLMKRRGFAYPGSEIYGGLANAWDYGPLGAEMKMNIRNRWWNKFVRQRADIVGVETAIMMNTKVWEASGHLEKFSDPLAEDKETHRRYRLDELLEEAGVKTAGMSLGEMMRAAAEHKLKSPDGNELTEPRQFNLMLKTQLGAVADEGSATYFRPETAQGMFVNFKSVINSTRRKLPFGIAQVGKAFRNEVTPGNFIFRTREFEQMEIEYFIRPPKNEGEWREYFEEWRWTMIEWMKDLGIDVESQVHEVEVPEGERAHYSKRTIDFEFDFPFGRKELYGLAYRGDFDLKNHMEKSGEDLRYMDEDGEKFIPHVIEPTWGVDRTVLAAITAAYTEEPAPTAEEGEEEMRTVLKLPKWLAPVKVAVLPLSKKEELTTVAEPIYKELLAAGVVAEIDATQSIGKRYRRQDEIGTPYCVTVDFESLNDRAVTVRDRDTMKQKRVEVGEVAGYVKEKLNQ